MKILDLNRQVFLLASIPLSFFGSAVCTFRNKSYARSIINPSISLGDSAGQEKNTCTAQNVGSGLDQRFEEYLDVRNKFFDHFLNEPESLGIYAGFMEKLDKISSKIVEDASATEKEGLISEVVKSFIGYKNTDDIVSIFFDTSYSKSSYLDCRKISKKFESFKDEYTLLIDVLGSKINGSVRLIDKDSRNDLMLKYGISENELHTLETGDQELSRKLEELRWGNLKNIYMQMHIKIDLLNIKEKFNWDMDKYEVINVFLNFTIRKSILLNTRLDYATKGQVRSVKMIESVFSDLKDSYNMLCGYFLHYLFARTCLCKAGYQTKSYENKNLLLVQKLLHFLPEVKKMSKYLDFSYNLMIPGPIFKSYILDTFLSEDIKLLKFLIKLSPEEENTSFESLFNNLKRIKCQNENLIIGLKYLDKSFLEDNYNCQIPNLNLFARLALEINMLVRNLQEFVTRESFSESLLAIITSVFENLQKAPLSASQRSLSKTMSDILSSTLPEMVPNQLQYQFKQRLLKSLAMLTLIKKPNEKLPENWLHLNHLKLTEELEKVRPINFENLKMTKDIIFEIRDHTDRTLAKVYKKIVLDQINNFKEFKNAESEREVVFLESIKNSKAILAQIFIFTPDKAKIREMAIPSPYEDRIKFCEDSIEDLNKVYNEPENVNEEMKGRSEEPLKQNSIDAMSLLLKVEQKNRPCELQEEESPAKKAKYSNN